MLFDFELLLLQADSSFNVLYRVLFLLGCLVLLQLAAAASKSLRDLLTCSVQSESEVVPDIGGNAFR